MSTTPSLRILILGLNYAPELTGIAPYTAALAAGLARRGHKVRVKTAHPHYPEWTIRQGYGGWNHREEIDGVLVDRLRHYVPRRPTALKRLASEASFGLRLLFSRWHKPDVVLLVSPALFSSAIASLRLKMPLAKMPFAVWVQDLYGLGITETGTGGSSVANLVTGIEKRLLRSADRVVVIHQRFANHVETHLSVASDSVQTVRNWTHIETEPADSRKATRRMLGWGSDTTVVLHAGNIGVKQALENVANAARLADETQPDILFVLMGNGNRRDAVELSAEGVASIRFLDPLPGDQFIAALSAADVLLVNERAGLSEMAVPSKLTSYFTTGLPVVAATDADSITAEEIRNSGAGIRVDPDNPEALLRAVTELRENPEHARALGAKGVQFRTDALSEEAALSRFETLLASLP